MFINRRQKITESLISDDVFKLKKMNEEKAVTFLKRSLVRKNLI
jgi:hypothetical protein